MNRRLTNILRIASVVLPLLSLTGCCGKFFPDSTDVEAVTVSPTNATILPGGTQQFTATGTYGSSTSGNTGNVTSITEWTSSDPSIATINSSGLATGIKVGTVTIKGSCDCYHNSTNLTVSTTAVTLTSIAVTPTNTTVTVGSTQQFTATGTYSDGTTSTNTSSVTWRSSSTQIATINSSGLATGVASGSTTITATSGTVSGNTTLTVQ